MKKLIALLLTLTMLIGIAATVASVWFLHRLDRIDGRSARRFVPRTWLRLSGLGAVVVGILTILLGVLISWIGSFVLYGFGQLVDNSDKLVEKAEKNA